MWCRGEVACHVRKQMRDIPETLQDNMGQKMRLTVNGLCGHKCGLPPSNNTAVPGHHFAPLNMRARSRSVLARVQVARPALMLISVLVTLVRELLVRPWL